MKELDKLVVRAKHVLQLFCRERGAARHGVRDPIEERFNRPQIRDALGRAIVETLWDSGRRSDDAFEERFEWRKLVIEISYEVRPLTRISKHVVDGSLSLAKTTIQLKDSKSTL
jgi:hypothetical protein